MKQIQSYASFLLHKFFGGNILRALETIKKNEMYSETLKQGRQNRVRQTILS